MKKKEKEKKKLKKRQDKEAKKEERKSDSNKGKGIDEMLAYVDEDGNITTCYPFNVFVTDDFIRFGSGATSDEGVDIDAAYSKIWVVDVDRGTMTRASHRDFNLPYAEPLLPPFGLRTRFTALRYVTVGAVLTIFMGALVGTLVFLPISLRTHKLVPFGIFLALGAALTEAWGDLIIDWYRTSFLGV